MRNPERKSGGQGEGREVRDSWRILHSSGEQSCVVAVDLLDLRSLDDARQRQLIGMFNQLCTSLDYGLQLLLCVRGAKSATMPQAVSDLDLAVQNHLRARSAARPKFSRRLFFVCTVGSAGEARLAECLSSLQRHLAGAGVEARLLRGEILQRLHDEWTSGTWRRHAHSVERGDVWVRGYLMSRLPGGNVVAGWLAPLLNVDVECDISLHLQPLALHDALSSLRKRLRDHSSRQMVEAEKQMLGDPLTDVAVDNVLSMRERLAAHQTKPLSMSLTAIARGPDAQGLDEASTLLQQAFRATGCTTQSAFLRHHQALQATAPWGFDPLANTKLVTAQSVTTCAPWVYNTILDPNGYHLGFAATGGSQVVVDPFATAHHSNANIGVFAASGQGKSFALGTVVIEAARHNVSTVVVDPEGEYQVVVDGLGGDYLLFGSDHGPALNPMDLSLHRGDVDSAVATAVGFTDLLCGGHLLATEQALVDSVVRREILLSQQKGTVATLASCVPELISQLPSVGQVVQRLCVGKFSRTFCSESRVQLDSSLTAICLRELPEELIPATTFLVAEWVWQLVINDPRPRHIVFDEVGSLCVYQPLRSLLVQLARRCRKYSASLVVATQNIADLVRTEEGSVIASNCATILLGGHRSVETNRMEAVFGLNQGQREFLETAPRGRFLLLAGTRRMEIEIDVPERYRELITGH